MCEYCGCQSLRAIDELTREHAAALGLVREAELAAAAADVPVAADAARRLLRLLEPHTAVEEGALFPAMAREHPEHVEVLSREHDLVHGALAAVAADGPATEGWQGRLTSALDVLREHILKEQDGLFPAALISLGSDDWDRVEQVRADVGSALEEQPMTPLVRLEG